MRSLTLREIILIVIMLLLIVGAAGRFGFQRLTQYRATIEAALVLKQQQLQIVEQLEKEWLELNRQQTLPLIDRPLKTFVENGVETLNLQENQHNLQMNDLTNVPATMEGIQVRLEQLNLDQLFDVLFFLENHKPVVLIEQLDVTKRPGTNLLRLVFRIYKQKQGE